jgi:hypothetical protein
MAHAAFHMAIDRQVRMAMCATAKMMPQHLHLRLLQQDDSDDSVMAMLL